MLSMTSFNQTLLGFSFAFVFFLLRMSILPGGFFLLFPTQLLTFQLQAFLLLLALFIPRAVFHLFTSLWLQQALEQELQLLTPQNNYFHLFPLWSLGKGSLLPGPLLCENTFSVGVSFR